METTVALKFNGYRYLLNIGVKPTDRKEPIQADEQYDKEGFYISPQLGFHGLMVCYFINIETMRANLSKEALTELDSIY